MTTLHLIAGSNKMNHDNKSQMKAVGLLAVMALLIASRVLPVALADPPSTTPSVKCPSSVLTPQVLNDTSAISQATVKNLATPYLAQYAASYSVTFNSVFYRLGYTSDCSVYLENDNVAYDLTVGNVLKYVLEISVNPALTTVLGVTEYNAVEEGTYTGSNWAGYEYYDSNGLGSSGGSWYLSSVSNGFTNECDSTACNFSFWVGQSANPGYDLYEGTSPLAQAGTNSQIYCPSGTCSYDYTIWYEFLPAGQVACDGSGQGINYDDYVTSTVEGFYESWLGGYQYFAESDDSTASQICAGYSSDSTPYMGEAYYTQYTGEVIGDLPQFYNVYLSGAYYYDSGNTNYQAIGTATNEYLITQTSSSQTCNGNSEDWNACPGSVSSGSYQLSWLTSNGY